MAQTFYDRGGRPVAYTDDGKHIFLFTGHAVAFIEKGSIYDYSGRHLGWISKGWVRDHDGNCALFTEKAKSPPTLPWKHTKPVVLPKQGVPAKGVKKPKTTKPEFHKTWAGMTGQQFFEWYRSD
ncbi:MAG: hypothetical protein PVJ32_01645 [Anaerolineales bacterium]|jgi:hypothetical protein